MRILAVFAHPDDECFCSGGTLAKYIAAGAEAMVVSATKGDAGQIHDSYRTTRRTLGAVRERELRQSCDALGVQHMVCWNYPDGSLTTANQDHLVADIVAVIQDFRPDVILTFGHDGGYGHPDHIAISYATERAVMLAKAGSDEPDCRLYFACFPQRRILMLEELSSWLMSHDTRFSGSLDFLKALSIFAEESTMLRYSTDFVETRWYPPGFCIIEQGEYSNKLFVILSGSVDVMRETQTGELSHLDELNAGQFFGEMGVATHKTRNAYVIAKHATTCLVFSYQKPEMFEGRGKHAALSGAAEDVVALESGHATHAIDVRDFITHKIQAIGCHRTQFPISPDMFPVDMLQRLFGYEFFIQVYPQAKLQTEL